MKRNDLRGLILTGAFFILIFFVSFFFDKKVSYAISFLRNEPLTNFFLGITFVSSIAIVFVFLTALFIKENRRKLIIPLWMTLFFSALISFILKVLVQRLRPYQAGIVSVISGMAESAHTIWDFSFPSFQAVMVFSALPFLFEEFPRFKYVWLFFACLVAISRVYLGVHYLSDVIAGALLGYTIGWIILRKFKRK